VASQLIEALRENTQEDAFAVLEKDVDEETDPEDSDDLQSPFQSPENLNITVANGPDDSV
jgi:hypothetical protein